MTRYVVVFAFLLCVVPGSGLARTAPSATASIWGIAPSEVATPDTAALKELRNEGVNALVLDVQRLGHSKTALKRIDGMRTLAKSLKMSLVLLLPQRGGSTPALAHVLPLCSGEATVRCASLAPSVSAAIKMARVTDKTRSLVAVYVSKPSMLAQVASLESLRRHILVIAPLYSTFNDRLWGPVIASAADSSTVDLAVAPVSTVGSPSVQHFGSTLSTTSSTAGSGPDVTAPSAPSLTVVGVTGSSASVWWLPSVDDVGVTAYRLYVNGTLFDDHGASPATVGNLQCGVPVSISVDAIDAAGNASSQTSVTALPGPCDGGGTTPVTPPGDSTAPATPAGVSVSGVGQTTATLSWTASTDNVGVTGYRLSRDGAQVGTSTATSFSFTGLTCATTYTLGVVAVDAAGNVSGAATANVATAACPPPPPPPDTTPPSTPTGLATSAIGQTSAILSWTASTDNVGVSGYRVFRDGSQVGTPTATIYNFAGLTCGTTYTLGVTAVDAAGNVSGAATASVATADCPPPPPPDTTPPSTPTGLAAIAVGQSSTTLSWTASTDDVGVVGYRLFRDGSQVGTSATTSYGYTGLTCATTYTLGVVAVDAAGNLSGAATANVATAACPPPPPPPDTTPPSTPTGVATSAIGQTSATLSWTASTDNVGVTGYRLFQGGTQVATSATTNYDYSGLSCGTTYTLGVAAVDAAGNASGTATKSITTTACSDTTPPSTPIGLATSTVGQTAATLSWTASTDNVGVTGYHVFRDGSQVGAPTGTGYSYTGLSCGTTYTLGVAAVDAAGNTSGTATKSVTTTACPDTTPPSTPTGLATSAVGQTVATLSWTAATDNVAVTGYRLFLGAGQVGTSSTTSFAFTTLSCATTYTLGVAALDAAGNVSGTATKSVTTTACPDTTAPSTPSGLTVGSAGLTSLTLSWNASTDNVGVTGYRLFQNANQVGTSLLSSYIFGGLACGTSYSLGVAAVDGAGNVSATASLSQQTAACSSGSNWYVAPNGSDLSSGVSPSAAFATVQRACSAAAASSQGGGIVEMAGGSYPSQTVSNCSPSTTLTVRPASGATVNIAGGAQPWIDGLSITGDANLTFQSLNIIGNYGKWGIGSSSNIVMQNMNTGRFSIGDGANISVLGGNYGPYSDDQGSGGSHVYPTAQSSLTNLLIDGITMHDYVNSTGNAGNHLDCLTVGGGNGVTLKNSTFYGCNGYDAWMKGFPSIAGATNVRFYNNVFRPNVGGTPQVVSLACNDAGTALANVAIEYNSFGGELNVGNSPSCTSWSNITIRGNILPEVNPVDCGKSGVSFLYNVVQTNTCGTTNTVGASGYTSSTNYHLVTGAPAIGRGDPHSSPATDHDGATRLAPTDAGAYQH